MFLHPGEDRMRQQLLPGKNHYDSDYDGERSKEKNQSCTSALNHNLAAKTILRVFFESQGRFMNEQEFKERK
jgi:hypothetical protein